MSSKPKSKSKAARQRRRHHNDVLSLVDACKGIPRVSCFDPLKVRYCSRKAAETAADKQWLQDRRILYPYVCCDHYHLTSQKRSIRHVHRSHRPSA